MEDMFSLGNVGLWKYVTNSSWAPTGEVGELFISNNHKDIYKMKTSSK